MRAESPRLPAGRAALLPALIACMLAGLAAAVGMSAAGDESAQSPEQTRLWVTVRRGDFVRKVRAEGRLRAAKVTLVSSPLSNHYITEFVPEGTVVRKGGVIARLDCQSLEDEVLDVQDQIAAGEADVAAAGAAAERAKLEVESGIKELEARLAVAKAKLKLEEERPLPERRKAAEAKLAEAQAAHAYAEYGLGIARDLQGEGVASDKDVREAALEFRTAEINLKQAARELEETLKGAKAEDLAEAKAEVARLTVSLREATDTREDRLNQADSKVKSADNEVERHRTRLRELKEDIGKATICAEHDGVVYSHEGRRYNIGDPVWTGAALADLADTSSLVLTVRVREADSQVVREDQPAEVRLLAARGITLTGTVSRIAKSLSEEAETAELRYLEADVTLDELPDMLRPGMTGSALIEVERVPDAVLVPTAAVRDGEVIVVEGAKRIRRAVTLGGSDGQDVVVESGLREGEVVALR